MGNNDLIIASGANKESDINQYHTSLTKDHVPRNIIGVPENLAGSLGTELLNWKNAYIKNLFVNGVPITSSGTVSIRNSVSSGRERSESSKSDFIIANGASNTAIIDANPVNLIIDINGVLVTITSDITLTSLQTAPSTNNTCQVNDENLGDVYKIALREDILGQEPLFLNEIITGQTSSAKGIILSTEGEDDSTGITDYAYVLVYEGSFQNGEDVVGGTSSFIHIIQSAPTLLFSLGSKYQGEDGTSIIVDNMGSEISSLIGQYVALKHGTSEIMLAYVKSSTELTNIKRGFFFDNSGDPIIRESLKNNDILTLYEFGWVFLQSDTVSYEVSYLTPIWDFDAPLSPTAGQYWYDLENLIWKRYNGSVWVDQQRLAVGWVVMDETNCIASRSFDFVRTYENLNTIEDIEIKSVTEAKTKKNKHNLISVNGLSVDYGYSEIVWDIAIDLESGFSEALDTWYYLYLDEDGQKIISPERPYNRPDLKGYYHPYNSWRFVGETYNDSSSNLIESFVKKEGKDFFLSNSVNKWHRPIILNNIEVDLISGGRAQDGSIDRFGGSSCFLRSIVGGAYFELTSISNNAIVNYDELLNLSITTFPYAIVVQFFPYGQGGDSVIEKGGRIKKFFKKEDIKYFSTCFIVGLGGQGGVTGYDGRAILDYS